MSPKDVHFVHICEVYFLLTINLPQFYTQPGKLRNNVYLTKQVKRFL
jgi:hypothetical protein